MFSSLRRLFKNERGNVIVIGATTMPMLIGASAIAIDTIQLSLWKRQLQRAADSSALAGARALSQQKEVPASVTRDLQLNDQVPLTATPIVENAPTSGAYAGDARAVRVVLTSQQPLPFWSFFTGSPPSLTVEATAKIVNDGTFCMVSLEDGNVPGIDIAGNAVVSLGCGMATNSRSTEAVSTRGSSTIISTPISAVGGLIPSSNFKAPTQLNPYSAPVGDPLAALPIPTVPTSCSPKLTVQPNEVAKDPKLTNGVACYRGMDIKGTINLPAGVYYIDGGSFDAGAQAKITCTGCTIILTSKTAATNPISIATVDVNAGAKLTMTAPSTGTYAGVLFYQDRRAPLLNEAKINGHAGGRLEGAIYLPQVDLTMNGTAGMDTKCIQLVARRLKFTGNGQVQNTCPTAGGSKAFEANYVRLVA